MDASKNLRDYKAVLNHAAECGRKLGKTKLYEDIGLGRLKKQPDGSFKLRDVDRYMASLPMAGTPDAVAEKAADTGTPAGRYCPGQEGGPPAWPCKGSFR